jgi:hypothetical protein
MTSILMLEALRIANRLYQEDLNGNLIIQTRVSILNSGTNTWLEVTQYAQTVSMLNPLTFALLIMSSLKFVC